jgi:hypothetical protein
MAINKKKMKIWNIQQTKDFLGEDICHLLPIDLVISSPLDSVFLMQFLCQFQKA